MGHPSRKTKCYKILFPNKWECGGGMVLKGESFQSAVTRQIFEEFGISVEPYQIHTAKGQQVIPGVRLLCFAQSGEVTLNEREFVEYKWVRLPIQEAIDWITGIHDAIGIATALLDAYGEIPRKQPRRHMGFTVPSEEENITAFIPPTRQKA